MKKFNTLKFRLVLLMASIIFLVSLVLFIYIRTYVKKEIEEDTYASVNANQEEVDNSFSSILDIVTSTYVSIINTDAFLDMFSNNSLSVESYQEVMNTVALNEGIIGEVVLWNDNNYYFQNDNLSFSDYSFITEVLAKKTTRNIVCGGVTKDKDNNKWIIFGKKVDNYKVDENACLIFCLKSDVFTTYLGSITGDLGYSFLTVDNIIIAHPQNEYIGSVYLNSNNDIITENDEEMIILESNLEKILSQYGFNWKLVSYVNSSQMFSAVNRFILYDSIIITLSVILGIILALIISSWLVTPIKQLKIRLHEFSKTGVKSKESHLYSDDIAELERSFDDMMLRISELIKANNIEQENKKELELYALQVQINPHFLYNTLDAIAWMAKLKKQPEIEKLVLALAQFFRISLHKGDKIITVEEEIELIKNYCIIELTKVPDQFVIEYLIDDDVKKLNTMKLILQPIVENSIKHGISGREDTGHITVKAYRDDRFIYYEVIDDGEGFDVPKDMLAHEGIKITSGYGLKNVDERIKLEYGKECGIMIESAPGKGTKVLVKFLNRE